MVGNEVTMVDVVPVVLDEINEKGIRLNDENGDHVVLVKAAKAEELTEKAELAILGM
jgi:ketopantoate reductase